MMTRLLFLLLSMTLLTVSATGADCSSEDFAACFNEIVGETDLEFLSPFYTPSGASDQCFGNPNFVECVRSKTSAGCQQCVCAVLESLAFAYC